MLDLFQIYILYSARGVLITSLSCIFSMKKQLRNEIQKKKIGFCNAVLIYISISGRLGREEAELSAAKKPAK